MGMRANVFVMPVGTALTASGDSTKLLDPNGYAENTGITVGEYDILALDFTVQALSAGGSLTFYYDRLGADGVWYQIYATPAFTGPGQNSNTLAGQNSASQEFGLKGRIRWALTGTAATVSASIVGK